MCDEVEDKIAGGPCGCPTSSMTTAGKHVNDTAVALTKAVSCAALYILNALDSKVHFLCFQTHSTVWQILSTCHRKRK